MSEERRSAPRARISGARVTYESALGGDRVEADALNLGRGGLFVLTEKPLPVGKRIALDIQVAGELVPWPAVGRVIWSRERTDGERRPAGMGVKLIDVDDAVLETIERLVEGREAVDVAEALAEGERPTPDVATAPIVTVAPERERTILGMGSAPAVAEIEAPKPRDAHTSSFPPPGPVSGREPIRPRERSIAFDLLNKEASPSAPPQPRRPVGDEARDDAPPQRSFASSRPPDSSARPSRRGGARWMVVVVLLAAAAAAAYWILGSDPERLTRSQEPPAATPEVTAPPLPLPPPSSAESTATAAATPARTAPMVTAAPSPMTVPSGSTVPAASGAPRRPPAANPAAYPPVAIPPSPGHGPGVPLDAGAKKPATEASPY
jgi:uncharacterized protein (TIGR02266 family)